MLARRGGLFRGAVVKVRVPQMRFWLTLIALGEAISFASVMTIVRNVGQGRPPLADMSNT
jgi:hypothetical protein